MDRLIKTLNKTEDALVAFTLLGVAILTFIETGLRYTISYTFTWFGEVANYTIIFCTYLGASIGVKYGTHFSMEALTEFAPDRVSHLIKTAAYLISGCTTTLFIYFGIKHLITLQFFGVKSSAMQIPMFIPYISIPLFSIVMSFRFFVQSYKHFRSFIKNEPYAKVRKREA